MKKFLFMAWTLLMAVVMQATTVTFSASEWATAQGLGNGDGVTSYTQEGVTVTFAQGEGASAPSWNSSQSTIAVVSGNTMHIAVAEGYELKQVVMTLYANSQASNLANVAWSAGKATASGTQVTWKGIADNVSATLDAVGRFVNFEVTYDEKAAPIVEDESKYNDTTEVTIAEWFDFEGYGDGDEFSDASYTKEGKTLYFSKGSGSTPRYYTDGCSPHLYFHYGNTLRIESPYKMRKVVFDFCSAENAESFFHAETPDAGTLFLKEKQVIWLGENRQMNWKNDRKNGFSEIDVDGFIGITIISDMTDNQVTVTFYDMDGNVLKSEKVTPGSSVTPPTIDDECFEGWDQSTAKVMDNMDVRPVKKTLFSLTAKEWDKQTGLGEITINGFTLITSTRRTTVKDNVTVLGLKQNTGFTIKNRTWLYNLVFSCHTEADAVNFAGSYCSNGALKQEGTQVRWTGGTDSLCVSVTSESVVYIVSIASECQQLDHFTVVFLGEDGQPISTQDVEAGSDATAPSDPKSANECKLFAGWDTAFTNVHSDLTIKPLWKIDEDCVPEGYVKVVFVDIFNKPIGDPQFILIGGNAVAPEAPKAKYHTFIGWDHPLTNITESVTIKPLYEFDNNSPDILSISEWNEIKWDGAVPGEAYAVRGIFNRLLDYDVEPDAGQLSFRVTENGEYNYSPSLEAYRTLYIDREPFFSSVQLQQGDTVIVYGVYGRDVVLNPYQDDRKYTGLFDGYVTYHRRKIDLPNAAVMYDFSGNGLKQVTSISTEDTYDGEEEWNYNTRQDTHFSLWVSGDYSEHFGTVNYLGGTTVTDTRDREFDTWPVYIGDINHDGKPDISTSRSFYLSQASDFTMVDRAIAVTNMDINRDGRPDYISLDRSEPLTSGYANYGSIMYQLPGGSFRKEQMQVFTWEEFVEQMTPEELDQYQNPQKYSLGDVSRYTYTLELGGACLAHAPKRNAQGIQKAPGIGPDIDAPTHAIDMNGDGLVDLIDEKVGVIYTNMDNGKWVWTQTNGAVIPVDLNGDGVTDFIFPGSILYTSIFDKSTNTFVTTTLYENATVDKLVYCYDFDKDGDVDILATFSSAKNSTGYAYTCFFTNDGNGHFTKVSEQNYGSTNKLWFSALQDIDGDGNYDLLAIRANIEYMNTTLGSYYSFTETPELVWLRGNGSMQFAAPASLGSITTYGSPEGLLVNAEDLNGDGKQTLWMSGMQSSPLFAIPEAAVNARPTAPAAPTLSYQDGLLTVTWGNGADDKTAVSDLTYALRIGTTSGGNDILMAHANADGSRRNFLDGNMGRTHKYTIDLRSYAPAKIYVSVQAIDAQHSGSVWSQEATVDHGFVPVAFVLDRSSVAINETVVLTYTALPEGYKHTWSVQDGSYVAENEGTLRLSFTKGGEKTITHTVTTPNGSTLSATAQIMVKPAGLGEPLKLTEAQSAILYYAQADYTYDGRMDGFNGQTKTVQIGTNTDELFVAAEGLWNTNINAEGIPRWFDWNKDGQVDLVFYNAYLPHESNGTSLTPLVYDDALKEIYPQDNTGIYTDRDQYYVLSDLDNNGYLDSLAFVANPLLGEYVYGVYVWYKDATGIFAEGFLIQNTSGYMFRDCYLAPDDHLMLVDNTLYPIVAQADARPAAPTNIQAEMTNEGLLISWTAAVDDHTPAANMRYNLSVKQQGASTYLISPQNGGNENAAYLPGYAYFEGTSYLIPTSELTNANYEIAMQALDRQNKLSIFSQTTVTTVKRNPIEVPSFGCADEEIVVSYRGAEMTGTPVWNFDGGQAAGSGFGPYTVVWKTGGEKNVTLTLNGAVYSATITIDDPKTLDVTLPTVLYEGTSALASVPAGIEYQWFVSIDGSELYPVNHYGILLPSTSVFVSYDYRLSAQGLNITAWYRSDYSDKTLVGHEVRLYLLVTNDNGCETYFYSDVTVLAATDIPTLTLISTDANGHNVLSWGNASAFATINVYKEGSAINDFRYLSSTAAAEGSFVDANSDATEKAERYYITGVTRDGSESPASTIHKTVHLAINRGVTSGTFNLIWNEYAGASVASYVILRGASPTSLSQIAVVAASNTSYTDQAPEDEEPYYAIEYVLSYAASSPANRASSAQEDKFTGRSNVVNRNELGIEDIAAPSDKVTKVLRNGQIYILIGSKVYTITGQEIVQYE